MENPPPRVKLAHSIVFVSLFVLVSMYCPTNRIGTRQNFFTFYKVSVQKSNTFYGELEAVVKKFILVNFSINDKMTALYTGVIKIFQIFYFEIGLRFLMQI